MPRRAVLIFAAAILLLAAGLGGYAWTIRQAAQPQGSGVALVGGPFSLTDQDGRRVTEKDFLGRYMLVFFGFTYCPDICPTELQVMTAALDAMGPAAEKIQPVFVSVDPERDTPEVMKAYVANFGPRLIGLTGTPEEIAAMAKAYRVYYAKAANQNAPGDYLMDHSSIIYLMDEDGSFVKHFAYITDVEKLTSELKKAITVSP
ncbi:SCO family protein [Aestuariivirga sp.]|uniref:SCO family protein n=1 Tax=Aestuariivirga sp. TaxID=2650926 RepID=UPI0037834BFB